MDLNLRRGVCKRKALCLEERLKWGRDHPLGVDVGMVSSPDILKALWGAGWGGVVGGEAEREPQASAFPSLSLSFLPTVFINLGFLAQTGFLFGLNSIPHPAYEEAKGLRRILGQR